MSPANLKLIMIKVVFIVQHRGLSDEAAEQEELCFPNATYDEVINGCVIKKPTDFTADNSTIVLQSVVMGRAGRTRKTNRFALLC